MHRSLRILALGLGFTALGAGLAVAGQALADTPTPPDPRPCQGTGPGAGMGPGLGMGYGAGMGFGPGSGHGGFLGPIARLFDDLDLTEAQEVVVARARADVLALREDHLEERADTRERLRQALAGPNADVRALHALADERLEARATMVHAVVDDFAAVWSALDDGQRAEVLDRLDRIGERRRRGPPER